MKFKKSISLALVMCMVLSLFASFVVSAEEAAEDNTVVVNVNENAMLTDGVTGFTDGWEAVGSTKVALINNTKCTTQAMDVVVNYDLGEVKAINALALDFYHDANVMIGYPEGQVTVEVSVDGESWTKVGLFDLTAAEVATGSYGTVSTVCEFNAVKAAHVRATFEVGSSTGVLGDSPADGKVFWEFCSLAEVSVTEANLVEVDVSDYAMLTDGVSDFTGGWNDVGNTKVALINNTLCKTNDMDVVVTYDLGEIKAINSLVLDFYHCADVMIGYPQGKVLVEVSTDGEAWSVVGLYDIAEAEVALGAPGTVSTVCEFAGRKAQYVRATFEVGASTGVLGESPADGKVFWEFCSLAEISVTEATVDSPIVTAFNVAGYLDSNDAYIYTDSAIYAATSFAWWRHVGLAPVEGKEGVYEVTEIIGGSGGAGKPVAIPEGGFAWTAWEWPAAGSDGANALAVMNSVVVGDYVQFTGLDIANLTAAVDASAAKYVDPNAPVNIALDKEYTLSGCGNRDSYYAKLTDGTAAATLTYNATDWFGFYHNDGASDINAPDKVGTVVIDLEEVYDLSSVRVNTFFGNTSGITNPTSVVLKVSEDGETFTEVETKTYEVTDEQSVSWITFDLSDVTARYVSLDFTLSNIFVFINEIEVYNVPVVVEEVPEGATGLDMLGYTHTYLNYIMYADADTTLGALTDKYYESAKDLNYFKVIVVNEDGTVDAVYLTLGRPDGVKSDFAVKAGQVVLALSANEANVGRHEVADTVKAGDIVTLYNVSVDALESTESVELTNAAFTVEAVTPEAPADSKEIVDDAFALESGAELPYVATLTGEIVKINTPYSEQYGNITVTITVEGSDGVKELLCYRIKGEGADTLAVGDTITVTGTIINYNGTIEYSAGSTIDAIEKGEGEVPVAPEDPKEIVDAAFGLEEGASLPYNATLTGVIVSVDTAYDAGYNNVTVSIEVEGTDGLHVIQCFRLKGEGADVIGVGDTITVTGVLKNYYGKIEFDSGCTLDSYVEYVPEYNEIEVNVNDNAVLTDGKTGFTGNWGEVGTGDVLLITNGECKNMAMQVVLNYALGETKNINGLVLDFYHCAAVMIGYPEGQILVEVSVDGENWTKVGLFDLAAAELANGKYGTVSSALEFDAVEAAYVKATFVVGSSTGVLGDSPADGKVFWEFASLAEVAVTEVKTYVTGNFAEEGLNGVNQFAANAHNIWTGSAASIEWWTKALLQWNAEAQGWEVLKVQGNGKVDWVIEGNQIVIAAHADNGTAVASIAALQVGDIVYIWDIGVATSDKLAADLDCNGGFYTTDASKVGTTAFTYKEKTILAGDVNMDGAITDADYMIIRKLVVGTEDEADYTAEQLKLADVNGNGVIDANDYLVVKRHALGTYVIPAWR